MNKPTVAAMMFLLFVNVVMWTLYAHSWGALVWLALFIASPWLVDKGPTARTPRRTGSAR